MQIQNSLIAIHEKKIVRLFSFFLGRCTIFTFMSKKYEKWDFQKNAINMTIITLMKQLSFAKEKGEAKQRIIEKKDIERN